jgi:hypothetical protein
MPYKARRALLQPPQKTAPELATVLIQRYITNLGLYPAEPLPPPLIQHCKGLSIKFRGSSLTVKYAASFSYHYHLSSAQYMFI